MKNAIILMIITGLLSVTTYADPTALAGISPVSDIPRIDNFVYNSSAVTDIVETISDAGSSIATLQIADMHIDDNLEEGFTVTVAADFELTDANATAHTQTISYKISCALKTGAMVHPNVTVQANITADGACITSTALASAVVDKDYIASLVLNESEDQLRLVLEGSYTDTIVFTKTDNS